MTEQTTIVPLPEPFRETLWVNDAELIRRLGIPEKKGRRYLRLLDKNNGRDSGFPQKNEFWDNRRYWPAVREFMDRTNGLIIDASPHRRRRRVNVG
jgi:hypothetical protein